MHLVLNLREKALLKVFKRLQAITRPPEKLVFPLLFQMVGRFLYATLR